MRTGADSSQTAHGQISSRSQKQRVTTKRRLDKQNVPNKRVSSHNLRWTAVARQQYTNVLVQGQFERGEGGGVT